jgi:hypothetical protein
MSEIEETDPFDIIRDEEDALETIAARDWQDHEQIGAAARIVLALARGDRPNIYDLEIAGIPANPTVGFAKGEESQ